MKKLLVLICCVYSFAAISNPTISYFKGKGERQVIPSNSTFKLDIYSKITLDNQVRITETIFCKENSLVGCGLSNITLTKKANGEIKFSSSDTTPENIGPMDFEGSLSVPTKYKVRVNLDDGAKQFLYYKSTGDGYTYVTELINPEGKRQMRFQSELGFMPAKEYQKLRSEIKIEN